MPFSLRAATYEQKHQGLTSLFVQNFLQFVESVQFVISAAFRTQEYSVLEKIYSWTGNISISI